MKLGKAYPRCNSPSGVEDAATYYIDMEPIQITTTVRPDGLILVPDLQAGDVVEITVVRKEVVKLPRKGGWAKGKIHILPGFDDPIPGMEEYQ